VKKYGRSRHATYDSTAHAFVCWITKTKYTHSEYVILVSFLRKHWLRERASLLRLCVQCCHEKSALLEYYTANSGNFYRRFVTTYLSHLRGSRWDLFRYSDHAGRFVDPRIHTYDLCVFLSELNTVICVLTIRSSEENSRPVFPLHTFLILLVCQWYMLKLCYVYVELFTKAQILCEVNVTCVTAKFLVVAEFVDVDFQILYRM
jgi:hypothetical protein